MNTIESSSIMATTPLIYRCRPSLNCSKNTPSPHFSSFRYFVSVSGCSMNTGTTRSLPFSCWSHLKARSCGSGSGLSRNFAVWVSSLMASGYTGLASGKRRAAISSCLAIWSRWAVLRKTAVWPAICFWLRVLQLSTRLCCLVKVLLC